MSSSTNLLDLSPGEMLRFVDALGEPPYRARQLSRWIYHHKLADFEDMQNLPRSMRARLAAEARIGAMEVVTASYSTDNETRKYLLRLHDGQLIETVLMEYSGVRRTACISTQAGCAMGCVFCATGQMGFARHLTCGEIVEQALFVARILQSEGERLSNVVLMGMGEPFHNYDAVIQAIRRISSPQELGIGQRHITISTVGLVPAIYRFAEESLQVGLAISLHATTDEQRTVLLPVNRRYPLSQLLAAVRAYIAATGRRVSFEWALIEGQNDTPEQAHSLGALLSGLKCHVNVIPLNPTANYAGRASRPAAVGRFVRILESYRIPASVRIRRGIDIDAGCGQLKAATLSMRSTPSVEGD